MWFCILGRFLAFHFGPDNMKHFKWRYDLTLTLIFTDDIILVLGDILVVWLRRQTSKEPHTRIMLFGYSGPSKEKKRETQ